MNDFDTYYNARVNRRKKGLIGTAQVWGSAFGWDRLRVRILDRRFLVNGDLIDDFLTVVSIEPKGCDFQRSEKTSVANASPGWRVLEAVRALYGERNGLPASHPLSQSLPHEKEVRKLVGRAAQRLGKSMGWKR